VPYVLVLLVATAAGVGVWWSTLRSGRLAPSNPEAWTETYREDEPELPREPSPPPKRPLPPDPNVHTRTIGAAGLAGAVLGAAAAIAVLAYLVWTAVKGIVT
jgi:hypothetical protein